MTPQEQIKKIAKLVGRDPFSPRWRITIYKNRITSDHEIKLNDHHQTWILTPEDDGWTISGPDDPNTRQLLRNLIS